MKITDVNVETGEVIVREMTEAEIIQAQLDKEEADRQKAELQAKAAARQAILNRLGITEEEAKILLG